MRHHKRTHTQSHRRSYLFALLLLLSVIPGATRAQAGGNHTVSTRVVGGKRISEKDSPVVRVRDFGETICTGSLIAPDVVLTAAHCVSEVREGGEVQDPRFIDIILNGKTVGVREIKVPEETHVVSSGPLKGALLYDIALLFLNQSVDVTPLPLLVSRDARKGDRVQVMGYGRSKDAFEGALHAGYARLNKRITNFYGILIKKGEATACPGDSGGPLLSSYKGAGGVNRAGIIGVVHGGESSQCRPGEWAAYTRLQESVALSFITTNVPGVGLQ